MTPDNLAISSASKKFKYGLAEESDQVGVVTGLAYTSVGGELLNIEALRLPGKGRMKTTGTLGDVMKESIDAASSYVRSVAPEIGVKPPRSRSGISTFTSPRAPRPRTGRVRAGDGDVDRVGADRHPGAQGHRHDRRGDAARQRAAHRRIEGKAARGAAGRHQDGADPAENEKDLAEIPDNVKEGLEIIPVAHVRDVLDHALVRQPEPIEWDEAAEEAAAVEAALKDRDGAGTAAHH